MITKDEKYWEVLENVENILGRPLMNEEGEKFEKDWMKYDRLMESWIDELLVETESKKISTYNYLHIAILKKAKKLSKSSPLTLREWEENEKWVLFTLRKMGFVKNNISLNNLDNWVSEEFSIGKNLLEKEAEFGQELDCSVINHWEKERKKYNEIQRMYREKFNIDIEKPLDNLKRIKEMINANVDNLVKHFSDKINIGKNPEGEKLGLEDVKI